MIHWIQFIRKLPEKNMTNKDKKNSNLKWRTIIGLILVYIAAIFNLQWAWGVLFLFWVIPDIFTGVTYFIEAIEKKENPFLYWFIVATWLLMSIYMIATPFIPNSLLN